MISDRAFAKGPSGGLHDDAQRPYDRPPNDSRRTVANDGFEVPQLGRKRGFVDGDEQHSVAQRPHLRVTRDVDAHKVRPRVEHGRQLGRVRQAEVTTDARE
jgi:hypothetical protein